MTDEEVKIPAPLRSDRFWFLLTEGKPDGVLRYDSSTMNMTYWDISVGDWVVDNGWKEVLYDPKVSEYTETTAAEALRLIGTTVS